MKDHKPIVIEDFKGLWANGDLETCPLDHFSECNNIAFAESAFETRPGIDTLEEGGPVYQQEGVLRMYNYVMETGETLLVLTSEHNIYHSLLDGSNTVYGPILHIDDMEDFAFHAFKGRAYITPIKTYTKATGEKYQTGVDGEFVYVYKGDGSPARRAAGSPPIDDGESCLVAYSIQQIGSVTEGIHVLAVEVDGGGTLGPAPFAVMYAPGDNIIGLNHIPTGATERKIYMTKAISFEDWNANTATYDYYLAKTISNGTDTNTFVNIADTDLTTLFGGDGTFNNSAMVAANSDQNGHSNLGLHVIGVVYETDTGYLTAPGPQFFAVQTFTNEQKSVFIQHIPTSPDAHVVKRHLVSTLGLIGFNGNNQIENFSYQFFYIPEGTIEDNTTEEKYVSFYDSELIEDASHLIDNFTSIPAGVGINSYNGRMAVWGMHDDMSVCYFSAKSEPEAIDQVEGFVKFPEDGKPLTNGQEFRDSFYLFKQTKTAVTVDNGQTPAFWEGPVIIDHGLGASIHGICKVLDSDGVNIDYILVVDWSGIMVFRGNYLFPSLTWKIDNLWHDLDRNDFANIQMMSDSIEHQLYMTLPNKQMLYGEWADGLDSKNIKWSPWTFDIETSTIALIETNKLIIGSDRMLDPMKQTVAAWGNKRGRRRRI